MTDQVNSMGSLASGSPAILLATSSPGPTPKGGPAKVADGSLQTEGRQPVVESAQSPELAAQQINAHLQQGNSELRVQADKDTGRIVFKIVDPNTGQVVLQVPSEDVLAMARNLRALDKRTGASGVLVDKQG